MPRDYAPVFQRLGVKIIDDEDKGKTSKASTPKMVLPQLKQKTQPPVRISVAKRVRESATPYIPLKIARKNPPQRPLSEVIASLKESPSRRFKIPEVKKKENSSHIRRQATRR